MRDVHKSLVKVPRNPASARGIVQVQEVLHTDPTSHREDYLEIKPDHIQDDKRCLL